MKKILFIFLLFFIFASFIKGYKEYNIGDKITYEDVEFYVIQNSSSEENSVALLKARSLSFDEVKEYLTRADEQLVSNVVKFDSYDYGFIPYYLNDQCNVLIDGQHITTGCITSYNESDIKKVVDEWVNDKLDKNYLVVDSDGNYARLINEEELFTNLGFQVEKTGINSYIQKKNTTVPDFLYDSTYWTMIKSPEREYAIMRIAVFTNFDHTENTLAYLGEYLNDTYNVAAVRPVITLRKQAIEKAELEKKEEQSNELESDNENSNIESNLYEVPNTFAKISRIIFVLGIILILIASFMFIKRIIKSKE